MQQVIEIGLDGSISGLERRGPNVIDLKQFGNAKVERVSEILFSEHKQLWYIQTTKAAPESIREHVITSRHLERCGFGAIVAAHCALTPDAVAYFESYDEAVSVEVQVLDHWRLKGW